MDQEIVHLLKQTFGISQNKIINDAQAILWSYISNQGFVDNLIDISINQQIELNVRHSALLYLKYIVEGAWDTDLPVESKVGLRNRILNLIDGMPNGLQRTSNHLSKLIIKQSLKNNEWPDLFDQIFNGFSDESTLYTSIILSRSYCSCLDTKNEDSNHFVILYLEKIISILDYISSLDTIGLIFHSFSRIAKYKEYLGEWTQTSVLFLLKHQCLSQFDQPNFNISAVRILKFIINSQTQIPKTAYIDFVTIVDMILRQQTTNVLKCHALHLLSILLSHDEVWDAYSSNFPSVLSEVLFPFYELSEFDLENAINNPARFVSENHKVCDNFDDPKSTISKILYDSFKHEIVPISIKNLVLEIFNNYQSQNLQSTHLFSAFHMFTSIFNLLYQHDQQGINEFLTIISPLYVTDDYMAQVSAFMLLSSSQFIPPNDIAQICISKLLESKGLIQYYATLSASIIFSKSDLEYDLSNVLPLFINMLSEYTSVDLAESIFLIVDKYGNKIINNSQILFQQFIDIFITASSVEGSESTGNSFMLLQSIQHIISIVSRDSAAATNDLPVFFGYLLEVISELASNEMIGSFLELIQMIIQKYPGFEPQFWDVSDLYPNQFISEYSQLLSVLCQKDTNLINNVTAAEFVYNFVITELSQASSFEKINEIIPAGTSLILRLTNQSQISQLIFPTLVDVAYQQINVMKDDPQHDPSIVYELINVLMITNIQGISEDILNEFIVFWLEEEPTYPLYLVTAVTTFEKFDSNVQMIVISKLLSLLSKSIFIEHSEEEDFDEFDDDMIDISESSFDWFNLRDYLLAAYNLFAENQQNFPAEDTSSIQMIEMIPSYVELHFPQ